MNATMSHPYPLYTDENFPHAPLTRVQQGIGRQVGEVGNVRRERR